MQKIIIMSKIFFYTATKQLTNLTEPLTEWTYIKQLSTKTPVDWFSNNVPEWEGLSALNLTINDKQNIFD